MGGAELIIIPSPGAGHLMSTVEIAKLLTRHDERLSITVLVMKPPFDTGVTTHTESLQKDGVNNRIVVVDLPKSECPITTPASFFTSFIESHTSPVRDFVAQIVSRPEANKLVGFVIDMFCTSMMDVANEFGVPTYVFYTSSAAALGLQFYEMEQQHDELSVYNSDVELSIPGFINPVPTKVLPSWMLDKEQSTKVLSISQRFQKTKGILVNTFVEMEPHAIRFLADDCKIPRIYHVGPIIKDGTTKSHNSEDETITWLDNQPPSSVVFLCFGSFGSFDEGQIREIAHGLEKSGQRFLWSLRRQPQQKGRMELPKDYEDPSEVLPEGFMERTSGIGKVIGWAPQMAILSHPAVGGFVSHCGWNSTLESIWCGVPMATWPLYAEQQINAFELVKELGIAVEIKMDYRKSFSTTTSYIVTADEIEKGIRCLMEGDGEMRKKVEEMQEKSRLAMAEAGSSYISLASFIQDVVGDILDSA